MTKPDSRMDLEAFFRTLSERLYNENPLSDLTYAILEAINDFRIDFVKYFGVPEESIRGPIIVKREAPIPGTSYRVDFEFTTNDWCLIVENKLWDPNYHFSEYKHKRDNIKVYYGLIANHRIIAQDHPDSNGWVIRSWDDFIKNFGSKTYGDSTDLFYGHLEYVKEVCEMPELKTFHIETSTLYSLYNFNNLVKDIIVKTHGKQYKSSIYAQKQINFNSDLSSYMFTLEITGGETLYPYFGIYYGVEKPYVFVSIWMNDNKDAFPKLKKIKKQPGEYTLEPGEDHITLRCPDSNFEYINKQNNLDEQRSLLVKFFVACCDAMVEALER